MAVKDAPTAEPAESTAAATPEPTETLSQFVARVLGQLSLSAWLPSTALVLSLDFIVDLGAQLDAKRQGLAATLSGTFGKMSGIGIGGVMLLVVAVVVLTMVTQAFSFEAIQTLEGYWGISPVVEWLARRRCDKHRRTKDRLDARCAEFARRAWASAEAELTEEDDRRRRRGLPAQLTPNVLSVLGAGIVGAPELAGLVPLTSDEKKVVAFLKTDWESHAPAELLRRRDNLAQRLAHYPASQRILPSRLGNILRAAEDRVRRVQVQSFVREVFDTLPPSLQSEHDMQRTRLDLYCSMVFVLAAAGLVAVLRLMVDHWPYALCLAAIFVIGMRVMYGAALATAEAYGGILITIVKFVDAGAEGDQNPPEPSA